MKILFENKQLKESKKSRTVVLDNFSDEYVNDPEFLSAVTEILGPNETYGGSIKQIKDFAITVTVDVGTDMTAGSYGCKFKALVDGDFDSDYASEEWIDFDLSSYDNLVYQCWWEKESDEDEYYPICDVITMYYRDISSEIISAYLEVDDEAIMYMFEPIETALYDYVPAPDDFDESLQESLDDEELYEMAKFLQKFFAKQKMDDITLEVKNGHICAFDDDNNKWCDAELFDFIINEVLAFDSEGTLSDGLGAAEPFAEKLKEYANKFGVQITPTKPVEESLNEDFDEDERINALATYLNIDPNEISNTYDYEYETPEGDFYVVTEEEAEELAKEDIRNLYDDLGLESFTSSFRDWIIMNALDNEWFEDAIKEHYEYYVEDIESEASSMGYENRLIEEMHDYQVLSDDDFAVGEDGEPDLTTLNDDVDIDYLKEEFVDLLVENAGDPVDYCGDNFGWDWVTEMATQNNLIDLEEVVEQCIYEDGVAHFIARYDGEEIELGNGLYAYRTN